MAEAAGSKQTLEISVPREEVDKETERVIRSLGQRVRLPGFRPGKVPADLIRKRFESDIKQEVFDALIPKYFRQRVQQEDLRVVGRPDITEVRFEQGEPLRFKAEFEIAPEIELGEYKDLTVAYEDPEITEQDLIKRLEEIRDQKAEYINVDPRPVADGDHAVVSLESQAGVEGPPIRQEELMLLIGDEETLPAFSENLRGMSPGQEKEFEVSYPQDFGQEKLAGKTVRFLAKLKGIRRKERPELNDEFARDLGDYRTVEELREAVRRSLFRERQHQAQREAKDKLLEKLVDLHDFPVPEAMLDRQIEIHVERQLRLLAAQGVDPQSIRLDWEKVKKSQREKATRDVKASLLVDKIAQREGIEATGEEVEREVERIARQEREPAAAARARLEKEGALGRIASHIRSEKTLSFLFEHARKTVQD